ncbi:MULTISPECIES: DUF2059 domain-containing protein [Winogradskyella]|uniref:DUF2059 domain-containing protein n=1 Tax=Winogradskyella TaxID=286104 RepID=UPI0015C9C4B1|nr:MULTISPECIES: DUF2059 domain-containing protein [Winogradskyella]QXP78703.1 DUF2059 domain-containing protein [Winogradskyella sp. HaHa_3_26]|tara:strand:+ start:75 stop:1247 length:1173 start_codon:yes stop_codon:yes gene_type:complete
MTKTILITLITFFSIQINAQTVDGKIEKLLELDGTISNIEKIITQTIEYQKKSNFGISDNYWEALEKKVTEKSLTELKLIVTPIYSKNYTEIEIDNLITFYNSETGRLIIEKQPIIMEELNLPLMQWSQNLGSYVIEEIENKGKNESSSDEKEKFKTEFKDKYGLQILNLTDLAIDKENNIGDLLVDFGKTDGKKDITKIIRVKNNSNKEIEFQEPKFLSNEVIKFDLGNKPLGIGEIRDLKITLIAELAENKSYSMSSINYNNGNSIQFGIKYDAPAKEISFEISTRKLKFKKLKKDFSKPYVFILKNTGKKDFYISDIELDKQIAYLNWNKETIKPNEETEIRLVFSKHLIAKQKNADSNLKLEVDLTKGEKGGFSSYANETIELTIE